MLGTLKIHIRYNIFTCGKLQYLTSLRDQKCQKLQLYCIWYLHLTINVDNNYYKNL